jgi:hypothetical protein
MSHTTTTYEIDYYAREYAGVRYHIKTAEIEVPSGTDPQMLPFILRDQFHIKHHGFSRVKVRPQCQTA